MNRSERFEAIAHELSHAERVAVSELASRFSVSEMTVRRDLEQLENQGICRRVHGGAVAATSRSFEPPFALRGGRHQESKRRIGKVVADDLSDGETVLLDIGTTTLAVAETLCGRRNLTVLTPSLHIAHLLADEPGIRLICLGGEVRQGERSLVGAITEQALTGFHLDVCVLGVGGIDAEAGVTEFNLDDAAVKRAAIAQSRRLVVAADESKLGVVAFASVATVSQIDLLVTNATAEDPRTEALKELGVEIRHT